MFSFHFACQLSDAQVQEILEQLGDRSLKESLDSKKKSKEGKHNTVKKDKKKLKKQKKSEKKKKAEPEERSDTEESDIPPKPSATDDVFTGKDMFAQFLKEFRQ